jgi:hypothetical protein
MLKVHFHLQGVAMHSTRLRLRALSCATAALLLGTSGLALAHNCPNEMKAIDAKLATQPSLSADNAAKVKQLRAEGETQHKAGNHSASMQSLGEAKKLLGM